MKALLTVLATILSTSSAFAEIPSCQATANLAARKAADKIFMVRGHVVDGAPDNELHLNASGKRFSRVFQVQVSYGNVASEWLVITTTNESRGGCAVRTVQTLSIVGG